MASACHTVNISGSIIFRSIVPPICPSRNGSLDKSFVEALALKMCVVCGQQNSPATVELTGSSVFDYVHPGDQVEMAEQLGMKLPPGRGLLSQGGGAEDGASSASSSSHSETPEPVLFW
ncbi:hypothetical protein P4O66_001682 [Electrophorus voltai]|uniref:PAS domain-containing protein n=1 Tax=Electrophorus voltai TaxID=2609070 RepID=A0AAD8Z7W4_9TELE|nr:hypothetical protein P4O66_001682 [Electrophorus voltai]